MREEVRARQWHDNERLVKNLLDKYFANNEVFFITIGAYDGISFDPSYEYIIKYAWKGILVEPQKEAFDRLVSNYGGSESLIFVNAAVSDQRGHIYLYKISDKKYKETYFRGMSTIAPQKTMVRDLHPDHVLIEKVQSMTFDDIISKYKVSKLDYLQIDAEGYDFEIIKMIDFSRLTPRIIRFEYTNLSNTELKTCRELLKGRGYRLMELEEDIVAIYPILQGVAVK